MKTLSAWWVVAVALAVLVPAVGLGQHGAPRAQAYFGFDKDGYPGDDLLPLLHRSFAYTGFWLNDPPGMKTNPWAGKRAVVRAAGFGFLLLFNGRLDAQLSGHDAAALGREDAAAAVRAALREGFPRGAILFLDQEEGGALLEEQVAYLGAWIAAVRRSPFKPGIYCSGVSVPAGAVPMSTAEDVEKRFPAVVLWTWNDRCPPSPGCAIPGRGLDPGGSGVANALVWQYAQSPRRPADTARCAKTYASDGQCYVPALPHTVASFVDLNVSRSADPSHGR